MPCAASPPSTFCQDQVTTSSLSQAASMAKAARGGVGDHQPARGRRGSSRRRARARRRWCRSRRTPRRATKSTCARSGSWPYGASSTRASGSFSCLTTSVAQSSEKLSKASTSTGAGAEQRPQRHLDRAGVGGGHDAEQAVGGNAEHLARAVDGLLEGAFPLGAVAAAERRARERVQRPAGTLGART